MFTEVHKYLINLQSLKPLFKGFLNCNQLINLNRKCFSHSTAEEVSYLLSFTGCALTGELKRAQVSRGTFSELPGLLAAGLGLFT